MRLRACVLLSDHPPTTAPPRPAAVQSHASGRLAPAGARANSGSDESRGQITFFFNRASEPRAILKFELSLGRELINTLLDGLQCPLLSNSGQNVAMPRMSAKCQSRHSHPAPKSRNVCCYSNSGQMRVQLGCPLSAISDILHRKKAASIFAVGPP